MSPRALLVDWGGVLTTSPYASFAQFCEAEGRDPDSLSAHALTDSALGRLFADLEAGAIDDGEFERRCAAALDLDPAHVEGLLRRLFSGMRADQARRSTG